MSHGTLIVTGVLTEWAKGESPQFQPVNFVFAPK